MRCSLRRGRLIRAYSAESAAAKILQTLLRCMGILSEKGALPFLPPGLSGGVDS